MLVLSRKNGESIRIGNEIEIKVVGVRNGQVRIAIDCPREIAVDRHEIAERKSGNIGNNHQGARSKPYVAEPESAAAL